MIKLKNLDVAVCGATLCLLSVAIGAFGAHALRDTLLANGRADVFELANRYQFYHGLALLASAALFDANDSTLKLKLAVAFMIVGIVVFSGSLYALALTNITMLGAITPIGGLLLLAAWAILIWCMLKPNDKTG